MPDELFVSDPHARGRLARIVRAALLMARVYVYIAEIYLWYWFYVLRAKLGC
jgi:hypothetical protein